MPAAFDRCEVEFVEAIVRTPAIGSDVVPDAPPRIRELPDYTTSLVISPINDRFRSTYVRMAITIDSLSPDGCGQVMLRQIVGGSEVDDHEITVCNRYGQTVPGGTVGFVSMDPTDGKWYLITADC